MKKETYFQWKFQGNKTKLSQVLFNTHEPSYFEKAFSVLFIVGVALGIVCCIDAIIPTLAKFF